LLAGKIINDKFKSAFKIMILGIKELHRLVKEIKLVEGLCDREINNPEGAGFDLRLGEVYELEGDGFLGTEERQTPTAKLIAKANPNCASGIELKDVADETEDSFIFTPGKYYLVKTMEKVNLPTNLSGIIFPRTTMFRSGLGLFNGIVQPGYSGELSFGICNLGKSNIKVSFGARIVHITFHEVFGDGNQYRGQWQGGRVATGGIETQI
jgi:deoxycytidine triphosphate deaminase